MKSFAWWTDRIWWLSLLCVVGVIVTPPDRVSVPVKIGLILVLGFGWAMYRRFRDVT
jgi:flagellar biosynthesis protein FliP